jgi:FkbM family methyltransferase
MMFIYKIILILIIIILLSYITLQYECFEVAKYKLELNPTINSYLSNQNKKILWQDKNSTFMKNNFPNTFEFDKEIKQDIIDNAILLPKNYAIIDCGAHIGDGAIPIAHTLINMNRSDITVYAIDPSKYKCDFINYIKKKNNLYNLVVLNYGLSDKNEVYKQISQSLNKHPRNTGGMIWSKSPELYNDNNKFIKLDDLVKKNIIKHKIGIIHLDVEGMEVNALKGANETITKNKPYLSLENNNKHKDNNNFFLEWLPKGYKYKYNKNDNNILMY